MVPCFMRGVVIFRRGAVVKCSQVLVDLFRRLHLLSVSSLSKTLSSGLFYLRSLLFTSILAILCTSRTGLYAL